MQSVNVPPTSIQNSQGFFIARIVDFLVGDRKKRRSLPAACSSVGLMRMNVKRHQLHLQTHLSHSF